MDSSFNNSLLDSSVDFTNCVNPSEACGLTFPFENQSLNLISVDSMESAGRVTLEKLVDIPLRMLRGFSLIFLHTACSVG